MKLLKTAPPPHWLISLCSAVGEMKSGTVKVEEWQQTMYGLDSGIQSGANTIRDDDDMLTSRHYTMTTTVTRENPGGSKAMFRPNVAKTKATLS